MAIETNWLHFGDDPHHYPDPEVRSGSRSGSGKNCHVVNTHRTDALQKSFTKSIMLAFGGGLCSLSTSSYHHIMDVESVCPSSSVTGIPSSAFPAARTRALTPCWPIRAPVVLPHPFPTHRHSLIREKLDLWRTQRHLANIDNVASISECVVQSVFASKSSRLPNSLQTTLRLLVALAAPRRRLRRRKNRSSLAATTPNSVSAKLSTCCWALASCRRNSR